MATMNREGKLFALIYLFICLIGLFIVRMIQIEHSPQIKYVISFDGGYSNTKGTLYEVHLEKINYGLMPIQNIMQCTVPNGLHQLDIKNYKSLEDTNEQLTSNNKQLIEINNQSNNLIKTSPKISYFSNVTNINIHDFDEALGKISICFQEMIEKISTVYLDPDLKLSNTVKVFFEGTLGMRILEINEPLRSELILSKIRNEFNKSILLAYDYWPEVNDILNTKINIISDKEESIAAWVATSYLIRRFYASFTNVFVPRIYDAFNLLDKGSAFGKTETKRIQQNVFNLIKKLGLVDLNEVALQISFAIEGDKQYLNTVLNEYMNDTQTLKIMDREIYVYGKSLLCFGTEKLWYRLLLLLIEKQPNHQIINHPCLNPDLVYNVSIFELKNHFCLKKNVSQLVQDKFKFNIYTFEGAYNNENCEQAVTSLLDHKNCDFKYCFPSNLLRPSVKTTFLAKSDLYHVTRIFGEHLINVKYPTFIQKIKYWCSNNLNTVFNRKIMVKKHAIKYCFKLYYAEIMFMKILQIKEQDFELIHFQNKIDKEPIEWTLGYLISNLEVKAKVSNSIFYNKLLILFYVLLKFTPIICFFGFKENIIQFYNTLVNNNN